MKKLFYTIVLLAGFQFAQGQEVTEILWQYQGSWYYVKDLALNYTTPFPNVAIPLGLVIENTNSENLLEEDTIVGVLYLNDSLLGAVAWVLSTTLEKDSARLFNCGNVTLPAKFVQSGDNELCADIVYVTVNGVMELVETEYCAKFKVTDVTSIADIDNLKDIKIYPNPVRDNLKIGNLNEPTDISVYSITGQLLRTVTSVMGSAEINMSDFSNGLYFVKLQSGTSVRTEKIQVIK